MLDPELIRDWIALMYAEEGTAEHKRLFASWEAFDELVHNAPAAAWTAILEIIKMAESDVILSRVAAGPLENLIVEHGATVIDAIELEARRNAKVARTLTGVWRRDTPEEIWRRVVMLQKLAV